MTPTYGGEGADHRFLSRNLEFKLQIYLRLKNLQVELQIQFQLQLQPRSCIVFS